MKRTLHKALSMLLMAAMVLNMGLTPVFAEGIPIGTSALTDCHTEHDENCGYGETVTVTNPCTHTCEVCEGLDSGKPQEKVCTCPPVDSGELVHGEDCPLYTALSGLATMAAGDKVELIRDGSVVRTFADLNTAAESSELQTGDTIKLLENVKIKRVVRVGSAFTDITFDLNGQTVEIDYNRAGAKSTGFAIRDGQTIHIKNGNITYLSWGDNGGQDECTFISSSGTTTMQNVDMTLDGDFAASANYYGLSASSSTSVINATNCTFAGTGMNQGAIGHVSVAVVAANGGKVNITGGSYCAKGGLRNTSGTITIAAQDDKPLLISGSNFLEKGPITIKQGTVLASTTTADGITTKTYVTAASMKTFSGQVKTGDGEETPKSFVMTVTDSGGNMVFKQNYIRSTTFNFSTKLLPGTYTLLVNAVGYHSLTAAFTIAEDTTENYTLVPMNRIVATVTSKPDGAKIEGATMTASKDGKNYQSWRYGPSGGVYAVYVPEEGTYSLSVSRGGYLAPAPQTVTFSAVNSETKNLAFEMEEDLIYDIFTAEDLVKFSQAIHNGEYYNGKTVSLRADIDMSGVTYRPGGSALAIFMGTFEGNGHTIRNLAISGDSEQVSLFDRTDSVTIRNLGLVDCDINTTSTSNGTLVGGIVGYAVGTTVIENCYVSGNVAGGTAFNGGLVGRVYDAQNTVRIENCYSNVTLRSGKQEGVDTQLTKLGTGVLKNSYYTEEDKFGYSAANVATVKGVERVTDPAAMAAKLNANIASAGKTDSWVSWTQSGGDFPTFGEVQYNCKVGDLSFTNLKSAMDYAFGIGGVSAVVTMTGDETINAPITVPSGKNLTILAEGDRTLTRGTAATGKLFDISGAGTSLTLGLPDGMGEGSSLTLDGNGENVTATSYLINATTGATFTMYDGVAIRNCKTNTVGAAIYEKAATLNIMGGEISGNTDTDETVGAGIYCNAGTLNLYGGKITRNTGGGIGFQSTDTTTVNLGGNPVVTSNFTLDGTTPRNFYLRSVANITQPLTAGAELGITPTGAPTAVAPVLFATAGGGYSLSDSDLARFRADSSAYTTSWNADRTGFVVALPILAPILSLPVTPTGDNLTDTTAKITFTSDSIGNFYYLTKLASELAPTAAEVFANTDSETPMTADAANTITLTGLSPNTAYTVYIMARDKADRPTADATVVSFTTEKPAIAGSVTLDNTTPKLGDPITVNTTGITSANPGELSYRWYRAGDEITGETGVSYTTTGTDVGKVIKAEVSAANYGGSLFSAPTGAVAALIATPTATGQTDSANTVTADKTTAQIGETVTYTVTFADGSTPTLALGGNSSTLSAPSKNGNKWTYTYTLVAGDGNITATADFAEKAVDSIAGTAVSLFADNANNTSAAELKTYLDSIQVTATYDNGTTASVGAAYTLKTGLWDAKGGSYVYEATASGKTCDINVTVAAVTADVTAPADISKVKTASGYLTHDAIGLPKKLGVAYTATGYTEKTDILAVEWSAVPTDFGKTATTQQFTGTVTLPAWATGEGKTTVNVNISDKAIIDSTLTVSISGWIYGDAAQTPTLIGYTTSGTSAITYTYSGTANDGTPLANSTTPPTKAGSYTVKASYEDNTQIGSATTNFTIEKKSITPKLSVIGVTKPYDKNTTVLGMIHPTITFSDVLSGETPTATATFAYDNATVGTNKKVNAAYIALAVENAVNANYTLSATTASGIGAAITQAEPNVTPPTGLHAITNTHKTLEDVAFTQPSDGAWAWKSPATTLAADDNSKTQTFPAIFTPADTENYKPVEKAVSVKVSEIVATFDSLDIKTITAEGGTETITANITIKGETLPTSGDITLENVVTWHNSCENIVAITPNNSGNSYKATVTGRQKGISMVGIAVNGKPVSSVLVKYTPPGGGDSNNAAEDIDGVADTIKQIVADPNNMTATEKAVVNAAADELMRLPAEAKKSLAPETIETLDLLFEKSSGITTGKEVTADAGVQNPINGGDVSIKGMALAGGTSNTTVKVEIKQQAPTQTASGKKAAMEFSMRFTVDGTEQALNAPLLITLPIPAGIDTSDMTILHKKSDDSVERITHAANLSSGHYTLEGRAATMWVDSFSTFTFMTEDNAPIPPTPPSGGGSGGNGGSTDNDEDDFWMSVKDKITTAESGDVVNVNARAYDKMPASVMDALRKNNGVTLVISWNGGKDITIPAGKAQKPESGRVYYTLSLLAELYRDISFVETPITDIANHWAKDDIQFVVARGLLTGTTETTFSPNTSMTRGMFVTALGRLAGIDINSYKTSSFTDVAAGSYYLPYAEWAVKNNIVTGTSATTFAPDSAITRQEMAVMTANYAKVIGYKLPSVHKEVVFTDSASIGTWAKASVKEMQMAGILMGKDSGKFDPTGTATRAEVSAMLRRFVELVDNSETAEDWKAMGNDFI